jgi:hypothetical protein
MITDVTLRTLARTTPEGQETVTYNPQVKEEVEKLPEWAKQFSSTDSQIRTIKCDGKDEKGVDCVNTASFDVQNQEQIASLPDWIRTFRTITLGNNRRFGYCSDVCEVNGVTTGDHNVPEPKQVQEATPLDAQRAIAEAKVAESMKTKKTDSGKRSKKIHIVE